MKGERVRRAAPLSELRGELAAGDERQFLDRRSRYDTHVDAARPGNSQRANSGGIDIDCSRSEPLDRVRTGVELREFELEAGVAGPAIAVDDEDLSASRHRDVPDSHRHKLLSGNGGSGAQQGQQNSTASRRIKISSVVPPSSRATADPGECSPKLDCERKDLNRPTAPELSTLARAVAPLRRASPGFPA